MTPPPSRPSPTTRPTPRVYLTPTERIVVGALTRCGSSDQEIAKELGVACDTVKTHMRRIYNKVDRALDESSPAYPFRRNRASLVVILLKNYVKVRVCVHSSLHNPNDPIDEIPTHECLPPSVAFEYNLTPRSREECDKVPAA